MPPMKKPKSAAGKRAAAAKRPASKKAAPMKGAAPAKKPAPMKGVRKAAPKKAASTNKSANAKSSSSATLARPLSLRSLDSVPSVPKSVRESLFPDAKFYVRGSIAEDKKGSYHGDNFILKKMFSERPYEAARRRALKALDLHKGEDNPLPERHTTPRAWVGAKTVLDLGANIGSFAVQAAWSGATVIAVEPDAETFSVLEKNVKENAKRGGYTVVSARKKLHSTALDLEALVKGSSRSSPSSATPPQNPCGRLLCLRGAVAHKAEPDQAFYLHAKIAKAAQPKEGSLQFRPDRPNRSSLIGADSVNNSMRFVDRVEHVWSLSELISALGRAVDVVKMDIEGSEREVFANLTRKELAEAVGAAERLASFELLVYYHLDKFPKLRDFDAFLTQLEGLFRLVHVEWTSMVPKPSLESGWNWREVVSKADNRKARGGYNPELEGKSDIGFAAAKKDILVYCRGVREQ